MSDKKAAAALALKERSQGKRFKLPQGDTVFRVLPNALGLEKSAFVEYGMHSEVGPRKAFLRCGKQKGGNGNCWLCDDILPKLRASGKPGHKESAERMQRKDVFAVQIAYQDAVSQKWIGPVLWETPGTVCQAILTLMSRREIDHPKNGFDLTISRTGTGMKDTRYGQIDKSDNPSETDAGVMSKLKPFKEVVRAYDEAAMKAAYYGHEQEEAEPEADQLDEPEPSAKAVSKNGNGKKPKAALIDDDELAELAVDDDDETPAPKAVAKGKKPAPPSDDDDELAALEEFEPEIENLEEEDEPKPKAGKKKPAPEPEPEDEPEDEPEPVRKPGKKGKPAPVVDEDDF